MGTFDHYGIGLIEIWIGVGCLDAHFDFFEGELVLPLISQFFIQILYDFSHYFLEMPSCLHLVPALIIAYLV